MQLGEQLQDPHPGSDDFDNVRIRLVHFPSNAMVAVTKDEFDRFFELTENARSTRAPAMSDEDAYMTQIPGGYGDTVVRPQQQLQQPPVDPYGQTVISPPPGQPTQQQYEQTRRTRPSGPRAPA